MSRTARSLKWICGDRVCTISGTPLIMGILNVTPDSFSDGGRYFKKTDAIRQGIRMAEDGADIIDIGGGSTKAGSRADPPSEEIRRVIPVICRLRAETDALLSIDTRKSAVAIAALAAGANIINDVSAMTSDPIMAEAAAISKAGVILMHMKGKPADMQKNPSYRNVVLEVLSYLKSRLGSALKQGVKREQVALDPGIGFGKNIEHNLKLIASLARIRTLGRPVVMGISRKRTIGVITGRDVNERLAGSLAAHVYCTMNGADILRVHDVRETADALKVLTAIRGAEKNV
jgi:dihydropteroate synthase